MKRLIDVLEKDDKKEEYVVTVNNRDKRSKLFPHSVQQSFYASQGKPLMSSADITAVLGCIQGCLPLRGHAILGVGTA